MYPLSRFSNVEQNPNPIIPDQDIVYTKINDIKQETNEVLNKVTDLEQSTSDLHKQVLDEVDEIQDEMEDMNPYIEMIMQIR